MKKTIKLLDLDCGHCADKIQNAVKKIDGVTWYERLKDCLIVHAASPQGSRCFSSIDRKSVTRFMLQRKENTL